jgi:hypothetical protein
MSAGYAARTTRNYTERSKTDMDDISNSSNLEPDETPPDTLRGPLADFIRALPGPLRPGNAIPSEIIDQARAARAARVGGEWAETQELTSP